MPRIPQKRHFRHCTRMQWPSIHAGLRGAPVVTIALEIQCTVMRYREFESHPFRQ